MAPCWTNCLILPHFVQQGAIGCNKFLVFCENLTKKFWLLLNQPASYSPFWPKFWKSLATLFVEIFEKEKKWGGSGPI